MFEQQLLDLFDQECRFDNFAQLGNELTVASLCNYTSQITHVFGNQYTGKTHLLKAWVNLANQKSNNAIYLTAYDLIDFSVYDIDLSSYHYIAIDDVDIAPPSIQESIFILFNRIKSCSEQPYLLTSSTINLKHCDNFRDDLITRIYSGVVFQLKELDDSVLLNALTDYAHKSGISIGLLELKFIINHTIRNLGQIIHKINQCSDYAITHKKNITIPLIKHII